MKLHELVKNIRQEFKNTLVNLGYFSEDLEISIEIPKGNENGDYSSNIAMKLARVARKAPLKIAEEIIELFNKDDLFISKIEVAKPGFINIFLDKAFLTRIITDVNNLNSDYK